MRFLPPGEIAGVIRRAQGCLLGQLAGDSPESLVEFENPERIRERYPQGVRDLADGGTWDTLAGQPTDDSEMALALARVLAEQRRYDPEQARRPAWIGSTRNPSTWAVRSALL